MTTKDKPLFKRLTYSDRHVELSPAINKQNMEARNIVLHKIQESNNNYVELTDCISKTNDDILLSEN